MSSLANTATSGVQKRAHTRVVHLQRKKGEIVQDCDVYIGRAVTRGGWTLKQSKWANPFQIGKKGMKTVKEVARAYENHVRSNSMLMSSLHELRGNRLGCWCYPKFCHGNILIKLMKEQEVREGTEERECSDENKS
jgi:hypothetical protein